MPRTATNVPKLLPHMSVQSTIAVKPVVGGRSKLIEVGGEASCREEILWNLRQQLQAKTSHMRPKVGGHSWEKERVVTHNMDLGLASSKQEGKTMFRLATGPGKWGGDNSELDQVMHTLVGNLALVLDPDPYYGDWWDSEKTVRSQSHYSYYGVNNACLQHPALLHIVLGMFRQAFILHRSGKAKGLLKAVPYADTKKALNKADWKQAWKNLEASRPWIEIAANSTHHWPFPKGYWERLEALHKTLFKHGPARVFGTGDLGIRWEVTGKNRSESRVNGAWHYFGTHTRLTAAGRRLYLLDQRSK